MKRQNSHSPGSINVNLFAFSWAAYTQLSFCVCVCAMRVCVCARTWDVRAGARVLSVHNSRNKDGWTLMATSNTIIIPTPPPPAGSYIFYSLLRPLLLRYENIFQTPFLRTAAAVDDDDDSLVWTKKLYSPSPAQVERPPNWHGRAGIRRRRVN